MTRRPLSLALAALALVGAVVGVSVRRPAAVPPALVDPRLAPLVALDEGAIVQAFVTWQGASYPPLELSRRVARWEDVGGAACARVEWRWKRSGRDVVWLTDWVGPGEGPGGAPELRCPQRQIGLALVTLDPPQPLLRFPLAPGQRWEWVGRAGALPGVAAFEVLPPRVDRALEEHVGRPLPGAIEVEQTTVVGPHARALRPCVALGGACGVAFGVAFGGELIVSRRAVTYVPGLGPVGEVGEFPIEQSPTDPLAHAEGWVAPSVTPAAGGTPSGR